jgi:SpoIID/LytB domain protein
MAGFALLATGLTVPATASTATRHEVYPVPPGGVFTIYGHGFGHGRGMSQWGAYGAAKVAQLSANQILHFYYPHTTLATKSTKRTIRVFLSAVGASSTRHVQVVPATGLAVTPAGGVAKVLPTDDGHAHPVTAWRLVPSAGKLNLKGRWQGRWHVVTPGLAQPAAFTDSAGEVSVVEPAGGTARKTVPYRGAIYAEIQNGVLEAVNLVNLELYLRSVVPAEMPATWSAAALQAQAVAARTYALRGILNPKAPWFDVFGDTRDQAYGGVGSETKKTTKAIHNTAGEVIVDADRVPILAQYSSSDGGWTVSGGTNYLPARSDPYDGAVPNTSHSWITTLPAARIAATYPSVGAVRSLLITGRDGHGVWGGRVTAISIIGTKRTLVLAGSTFQAAFGLRSPWFRPTPTPGAPQHVAATTSHRNATVSWKPPAPITGAAPVTGYRVTVSGGGPTATVSASTLQVTLSKLPVGTDTITVAAASDAGRGPGAATTVIVKAGH